MPSVTPKARLTVLGQRSPAPSSDAPGQAVREKAVAAGASPVTEAEVLDACRQVFDPEIPVNVVDLGLIYGVEVRDDYDLRIRMTLTAPACPVAGEIVANIADAAASVPSARRVEVVLVWEPAWTQARMTEEARFELGLN